MISLDFSLMQRGIAQRQSKKWTKTQHVNRLIQITSVAVSLLLGYKYTEYHLIPSMR